MPRFLTHADAAGLTCPHGTGRLSLGAGGRTTLNGSPLLTLEAVNSARVILCEAKKPCLSVFAREPDGPTLTVGGVLDSERPLTDGCLLLFDSGLQKPWDAPVASRFCRSRTVSNGSSTPGKNLIPQENTVAAAIPPVPVEIEMVYSDGSPAAGVELEFVLPSPTTSRKPRSAGRVTTDAEGKARITLSIRSPEETSAAMRLVRDPNPYRTFDEWTPSIVSLRQQHPAPLSGMAAVGVWLADRLVSVAQADTPTAHYDSSLFDAAFDFAWKVLQGDFLEESEQTTMTVVANVLLGLVPVLDQLADIRDITASLHGILTEIENEKLTSDAAGAEAARRKQLDWAINLVFSFIGCIPEAGTLAKEVLKRIHKQLASSLGEVLDLLRRTGAGNAADFLEKLLRMAERRLGTLASEAEHWLSSLSTELDRWKPIWPAQLFSAATLRKASPRIVGLLDDAVGMVRKEIRAVRKAASAQSRPILDIVPLNTVGTVIRRRISTPPLARTRWRAALDPERILLKALRGTSWPIEPVPGLRGAFKITIDGQALFYGPYSLLTSKKARRILKTSHMPGHHITEMERLRSLGGFLPDERHFKDLRNSTLTVVIPKQLHDRINGRFASTRGFSRGQDCRNVYEDFLVDAIYSPRKGVTSDGKVIDPLLGLSEGTAAFWIKIVSATFDELRIPKR